MIVLRWVGLSLLAVALTGCEASGTMPLAQAERLAGPPAENRICEMVSAVATGFGEQKVTDFAHRNLDLEIEAAKNRMVHDGAKGFSVDAREASCEGYIDFGGPGGREHKCRARARLCAQTV